MFKVIDLMPKRIDPSSKIISPKPSYIIVGPISRVSRPNLKIFGPWTKHMFIRKPMRQNCIAVHIFPNLYYLPSYFST